MYSRELLLCVNHFLCGLLLHSGILLRRCSNSLHSLDSLLCSLSVYGGCLLGRSCGSLHCCLLLDRGYLCGLCHIGRFCLHRNAVDLCSCLCRECLPGCLLCQLKITAKGGRKTVFQIENIMYLSHPIISPSSSAALLWLFSPLHEWQTDEPEPFPAREEHHIVPESSRD